MLFGKIFMNNMFVTPGSHANRLKAILSSAPHALVVMNLLIYILMFLSNASVTAPLGGDLLDWGANYAPLTLYREPWRLVTSLFVHLGLIHIAFNMWILWVYGPRCELMYGRAKFILIYFISGVAASCASVAWSPDVMSAGASGAIFGIVGAMIAYLGRGSKSSLSGALVAFVIYNVIFGIAMPNIDNAAHIGGLAGGWLCGMALKRGALTRRVPAALLLTLLILGSYSYGRTRMDPSAGLTLIASRHFQAGDIEKALSFAREAARSYPDLTMPYLIMGDIAFKTNDMELAREAYEKALEIDPTNEGALRNLIVSLLRQGRTDEGVRRALEALELTPDNVELTELTALVLMESARFSEAIPLLRKTIELGNSRPTIWANLGSSLMQAGIPEEAAQAFDEALKRAPLHEESLFWRGAIHFLNGEYEQALGRMEKSDGALDPRYLYLWRTLAAIGKGGGMAVSSSAIKPGDLWLNTLADLVKSKTDLSSALADANTPGKRTEVYFYAAAVKLMAGDKKTALSLADRAVSQNAPQYIEYIAAKALLKIHRGY